MKIVPMETAHYRELRVLWESFPGNTITGADSACGFELFLSRNGSFCFSAVECSEVVGSVMAGQDTRRGYIYHLAVRSDHQRSGLGGELMTRVEKALFDAGIEKVHLMIFSDNPAIEFYRKAGWHLRDDIEVMSKVLKGDRYMGTRRS